MFKHFFDTLLGCLVYEEGILVVNAPKNASKFYGIRNLEIEMVNPDALHLINHVCEAPHPEYDLFFLLELGYEECFSAFIQDEITISLGDFNSNLFAVFLFAL